MNQESSETFVNLAQVSELLIEGFHGEWDVVAILPAQGEISGRVIVKTTETKEGAERFRERLVEALNRVQNVIVPTASAIP